MMRTLRATIGKDGQVRLLEQVQLDKACPALVTIIEDGVADDERITALLSERSLAKDWNRPEEDDAWSHLQSEASS